MAMKSRILELVNRLLESAKSRNTSQGVVVYQYIFEELASENSTERIFEILKDLNGSLAGIEAHGYFTDREFELVQELRSIEDAAAPK